MYIGRITGHNPLSRIRMNSTVMKASQDRFDLKKDDDMAQFERPSIQVVIAKLVRLTVFQ